MTEAEYLRLVQTAKPLLDQIHLNICLCDKEGKILYVNPHAAESIKNLGALLGMPEIRTGYDVVGTPMAKWHRLKDFTKAMRERHGAWGTWSIKGARWRSRSDCVRDDQGHVIGYVGAWEEKDAGPLPDDKTEQTYLTPPYGHP
jgi:hypothetical protein